MIKVTLIFFVVVLIFCYACFANGGNAETRANDFCDEEISRRKQEITKNET